jgi:hypothetical protein
MSDKGRQREEPKRQPKETEEGRPSALIKAIFRFSVFAATVALLADFYYGFVSPIQNWEQFVPESMMAGLSEGQQQATRASVRWEVVHLCLRQAIETIIFTVALSIAASARLRRGAWLWWRNLTNVRSTLDALAKSAAAVGIIAALDVFTLSPNLQTTYVSCHTLLDANAVRGSFAGEPPPGFEEAFDEWMIGADTIGSRTPEECWVDDDYDRFIRLVKERIDERADREKVLTQIEKHSFQLVSFMLWNWGRGSASDLTLALPAHFELLNGPQGSLDMKQGDAVSWVMRTPPGETGHFVEVGIDFDAAHDPDLVVYVFALLVVWGFFVGPALLTTWWRTGESREATRRPQKSSE